MKEETQKVSMFNRQINIGHIILLLTFVASAAAIFIGHSEDIRGLQKDVDKHEQQMKLLIDVSSKLTTMIEVEKAKLDSHIIYDTPYTVKP